MSRGLNKMDVSSLVTSVVMVIVGIVVIFYVVGGTSATLTAAADNISGSGLPLAGLFSSNGVVLLIFMAGILLTIIGVSLGVAKLQKK